MKVLGMLYIESARIEIETRVYTVAQNYVTKQWTCESKIKRRWKSKKLVTIKWYDKYSWLKFIDN